MTRLLDWRQRLHAYIDGQRRHAFAIGERDCALLVAGAVEAMTGVDHAAEFRGRYRTLAEGVEQVKAAGYLDHVDMVAALFDEVRPSAMAQVGDIAVVDGDGGLPALGIVAGSRIFVMRQHGLVTVDLLVIKRAFRV